MTSLNFFYLAKKLLPNQLGVLSILITIPSVGYCLFSSGYHKAAIYYIGRKVYALETILANGLVICILLEGVFALLLWGGKHLLASLFVSFSFTLFGIAILSIPIQIYLFYLAEACVAAERVEVTILARLTPPIVYVGGCVWAGLSGELNQEVAFILYVIGILGAGVVGLTTALYKSQRRELFRFNWQAMIVCLQFGRKAQLGELAQYLALRLDLILVGVWAGMTASGYYSMATRIAETIWLIAQATQLALAAKVAQGFQDTLQAKGRRLERAVRYLAAISLLVSIGVIIVSWIVFAFFLPSYYPAFLFLLALAPGQVALALFLLMMGNLVGDGYPSVATKMQLTLFGLSLVFYLLLIPWLGAWGASVATSVTYLMSTALTTLILARMYKIRVRDFLLWKREDLEYLKASRQHFRKYLIV
ncbi:MAG: polysaccharide biosynthesis C-terminal domain-containing protein [Blastocatellia bacterium]